MLGNKTLGHFQGYHWICMISNAQNDVCCLSLIKRGAWSITAYDSLDLVETLWNVLWMPQIAVNCGSVFTRAFYWLLLRVVL